MLVVQWALIVVASLAVVATVVHSWNASGRHGVTASYASDFQDFYCAGAALDAGGDPFLTVDLDQCGRRRDLAVPAGSVHRAPAPIPSYALAVFRVLAVLPFRMAALTWLALSWVALMAAIAVTARLTKVAPIVVFAIFVPSVIEMSLLWGQLLPFLVLAIAAAAYALREGRFALGGALLALTMIEPHVGLPSCVATLVFVPRARVALIGTGIALLALGLATMGVAENVTYFRTVLPLHALAEVSNDNQYSLSWLAFMTGFDERTSIRIGEISYLGLFAIGIYAGRSLARRWNAVELYVLVPAAFSVIGGPFIHFIQLNVAVLAALWIAGRRDSLAAWITIPLVAIPFHSVPWQQHAWGRSRLEDALVCAIVAWYALREREMTLRVSGATGALAVYLLLTGVILHLPDDNVRTSQSGVAYAQLIGDDVRYASGQWGVTVRDAQRLRGDSLRAIAFKVPGWLGLGFFIVACIPKRLAGSARSRAKPLQTA